MNIYGNITEKEAKILKVMGCPNSFKNFVGAEFKILGAVLDNETKTADDGTEYCTNYVKIEVANESATENMFCKFTQTVIAGQLEDLFNNDLTDDFLFTLDYCESASGNRYLALSII